MADADSLDLDNDVWLDKSGLGNDGTITTTGLELFDGTDTGSQFYAMVKRLYRNNLYKDFIWTHGGIETYSIQFM